MCLMCAGAGQFMNGFSREIAGRFRGPPDWAATALHELGHWTGHEKYLTRDLTGLNGSMLYAKEELRAELASAFLSGELGIPLDLPNHIIYIGNWLEILKNDKR